MSKQLPQARTAGCGEDVSKPEVLSSAPRQLGKDPNVYIHKILISFSVVHTHKTHIYFRTKVISIQGVQVNHRQLPMLPSMRGHSGLSRHVRRQKTLLPTHPVISLNSSLTGGIARSSISTLCHIGLGSHGQE